MRCSKLFAAPATQTLLYQLLGGFVLLTGVALASGQAVVDPTPQLWGSLLFQVLVVPFASYLVWFLLMRSYLASRLGAFSFLTPLLGVLLGALVLGENIELHFMLATVPVLLGIVLVIGHAAVDLLWRRPVSRRPQPAVLVADVVRQAPSV